LPRLAAEPHQGLAARIFSILQNYNQKKAAGSSGGFDVTICH